MTVQAQTSVQYYDGPINVGAVIPITDFTFIDNSHVSLKIRGIDEIWEYGTDYTIEGANTLTRTITLNRAVEAGQVLAAYLDVPITQNISPEEGGNFPASTNEFVLDKLTYICQMLYERVARSMQVSIDRPFDGTLSVVVPGKAIKINAAGNGLELSDLDPDQAIVEIQSYIRIAEAAAEAAEQSKDNAQKIVNGLNVTKEQVDAAAAAAIAKSEAAIERVDEAEKHKLNSKEIATILTSSVPQSNTDLHLADGSVITSEDSCWAEFHNKFMKNKRALTDVKTKYYRYDSYNYSRIWYSKTKSEPTRFYTRTEQAFEGPIPAVEFDYQLEGPILRDAAQNIPGLLLTDDVDLVVTLIAPDTSETVLTRGTDFTITGSLTEAKATITFLRNIEQDYTVDIHTNEYAGAIQALNKLTFSNINNVIVNEVDSEGNVTQLVAGEDYEISGQGSNSTAEVTILKPIVQGHSFVVVDKGLDDVLYVPAGDVYIRNRHDDYILRSSISIRSYYKLKRLSHIGHEAPEYLLWEVKPGDAQKAEPSTEDANDFYVYSNDERIGTSCLESSRNAARFSGNPAGYGTITNIVVLPPDITSPYRRIQITAVNGALTYYYYYDVVPVELHAYVTGSVADLNLSSVAGVQTEQTVICPYLIPTHNGYNEKITNADFLTTEEWMAAKASGNDYRKFYSADSSLDKTFEIEKLHDEVEIVGGNYLTNRAGVFSGFTANDYLIAPNTAPKYTKNHDGTSTQKIKSFEICMAFKTSAVDINSRQVVLGQHGANRGCPQFEKLASTATHHGNYFQFIVGISADTWSASCYTLAPLQVNTNYIAKAIWNAETKLCELFLKTEDGEFEKQSEQVIENIYWKDNIALGMDQQTSPWLGSIDLTKSYVKINDIIVWGNKVVPYAKDSEGNFIREYAYNKQPEYRNEIASNVYETIPSGYTVVGNAPDVDGWWAPAAASQGVYLGTGPNTKLINHHNEDFIHLTGRFLSGRANTAGRSFVKLSKDKVGNTSCPFLLYAWANDLECRIYLGSNGTASQWMVDAVSTGITIENASEYFFDFYCDFTKKYNAQHEEDITGTLYKYTIKLRKWTGPNNELDKFNKEFSFYHSYRFGSNTTYDNYAISGMGNYDYNLNVSSYVNHHSIEVNGRHLFTDNIHVVDRNANATALPKISPNDGEESYVVVANGITEDVVLATPQEQIDEYTEDEILPQIAEAKVDAINKIVAAATAAIQQIDSAYAGQLSNMTQNYNESMRVITNTQCVLIDSYVNGTSWYRVYSDGWCEQGGIIEINPNKVGGGHYSTKILTFLVPFVSCKTYYTNAKHDRFNSGFTYSIQDIRGSVEVYQVNDSGTAFINPYVVWGAAGYINLATFKSLNSGT